MQKRYAYVDCFEEINEIPLGNPLIRFCTDKMIKKHLIKKFPNTIEEISYANIPGYYIKIPIIKPTKKEDEDYITSIIQSFNQHLINYDIDILVLDSTLKKYRHQFNLAVSIGGTLGLLYINEIIQEAKKEINKPSKEIRYVIVDGASTDVEFVLDHAAYDMNSLTLVTETPSRYEKKLAEIYEETGLAIQVKDKRLRQEIEGDLVIQCNKDHDKLFYCYQANAVLIDFFSDEEVLLNTKIKRKDLCIINTFDSYYLDQKWSSDLLLGIILNSDLALKNMYLHGYRNNVKDRIDKVLKKYPVKFELIHF
ncbi:MAG: hypothetical protein CVV02_06715 [Firmicutes bacterium HGW-Firmicutes-7]|nr:MAG: hypothetical protein CVV02_06715 [Firmicutes bacterium HGW-Firmicutes-7]